MPFDTAPSRSFERPITIPKTPEPIPPRKETEVLGVPKDRENVPQSIRPDQQEVKAADKLFFERARRLLDGFLNYTNGLNTLSGDQKNLLEQLRTDPRIEKLDEVVYTDPSTGVGHRFRDYFQGDQVSEQVLKETTTVLQKYQEAFANENRLHSGDWYKPQSPEYFRAQLEERNNPRDAKIREGWEEHNKKFQLHMDRIREQLNTPLEKLPSLEELKAKRELPLRTPESAEEAKPLMQESLGKLPSVEELQARQRENAAAAQSFREAQTVVMPQQAQAPVKKSVFSRIKSFFT